MNYLQEEAKELTLRQQKALKILDEMINELDKAGVDTSHFPIEAERVLIDTAIKIVAKFGIED